MTTHLKAPSIGLLLCLVGFPQLSETIYSPALPSVAQGLATTNQWVQWTLSIYFAGFALGVFYWGRISDKIGRRPAMLLGILVYLLGTLGCLSALSITWLLAARFLQAFGASAGSIIVQTMIRESFDEHERHRVSLVIVIGLALAPAIGPLLGGYISHWFGWRANFTFLVLMGLCVLIYSFTALPETQRTQGAAGTYRVFEIAKLIFKDKHVLGCMGIIGAINGILFGFYAEGPFVFIQQIGLKPSQFGKLGLFIAAATLLGAATSRKLINRLKPHQLLTMGYIIMTAGAVLLVLDVLLGPVNPDHPIASVLLLMLPITVIIFASFGAIIPIIISIALVDYKSMLGTAGALFSLGYYILIGALLWLVGILHNGTIYPMPFYFLSLSFIVMILGFFLVRAE